MTSTEYVEEPVQLQTPKSDWKSHCMFDLQKPKRLSLKRPLEVKSHQSPPVVVSGF